MSADAPSGRDSDATPPPEPDARDAAEAKADEPAEKKPARKRKRKAAKAPDAQPATAAQGEAPAQKAPKAKRASKRAPGRKAAAEKPSAAESASAAKAKAAPAERKAPAAAPARRPSGGPRRKAVRARARYVRTSARKARMVCGHLRGKSVHEARAILAFTPREVARDWSKLLESAVANAESNHELLEDDLIVREAYADEGPTIKRFRPRAMGRATPIRKRTSHLTITLTPIPERPSKDRQG
ncbi:MAG: large subunit ribosomal protein [Solirubrobacteraceae bacterium]|jgi:ribosomal protein L22|nr:large subunit ribosomal protein [Solirubrobacteraceae bacterium]